MILGKSDECTFLISSERASRQPLSSTLGPDKHANTAVVHGIEESVEGGMDRDFLQHPVPFHT